MTYSILLNHLLFLLISLSVNIPGQNIRIYDEPTGTIEIVKFLSPGPQQGYITIQADDANPTMVGI